MRRQRRQVEFRSVRAFASRTAKGQGELRLRVREDGSVRARILSFSRYSIPPSLAGEVTAGPGGGAVLAGTIRESYGEVLVPRMFSGLALFMAAVLGGILAARDFGSPGVYVCGAGAIVLGLFGYVLGRLRRSSFRRAADELERAVRGLAEGDDAS